MSGFLGYFKGLTKRKSKSKLSSTRSTPTPISAVNVVPAPETPPPSRAPIERSKFTGLVEPLEKDDPRLLKFPHRIWDITHQKSVPVTPEILDHLRQDSYVVVSHVWGSPTALYNRDYPGVHWQIPVRSTRKVDSVIAHAQKRGYKYLWMDVLCIKQDDDAEKEREVPRMGHYYSLAAGCIVMMECGTIAAEQYVWSQLPSWPLNPDSIAGFDPKGGASHQMRVLSSAIATHFEDEWFWRVWTYQECILPTWSAEVICDHGDCSEHTIDDWLEVAVVLQEIHSRSHPGHLPIARPWPGLRNFGFIYSLGKVRARGRGSGEGKAMMLGPLVNAITGRECSRKDDRLFGILGLLAYGHWMTVEYGEPQKAWKEMATVAILAGDVSILAFKRCVDTGPSNQSSLPPRLQVSIADVSTSTVDGWRWLSAINGSGPTNEYDHLNLLDPNPYHIDLSPESSPVVDNPKPPYVDSNGILHLNCLKIGTLEWVAPTWGYTDDDPEDLVEVLWQLHHQAEIPTPTIEKWLTSMLETTATTALSAIPLILSILTSLPASLDTSEWTHGSQTCKLISRAFKDDSTHGLWDIRNTIDKVLQQYGNRTRLGHIGRPAVIINAATKTRHIVVLDQPAPVRAEVWAYAVVERAGGRKGLMTLVCEGGEGGVLGVRARSTPVHGVDVSGLATEYVKLG
ncbi:hypothetical protein HDV00_004051 [Rhizophlyctis rosea]|nr:hypothetical protein HDV00_004051 [Rhizophlyctis rosea]